MQSFSNHLRPGLLGQARTLEAMNYSLRQYLGAPLGEHCWVSAPRESTLVIVTDGGLWATRLRYQQQEILKLLNGEFRLDLRRMRIRIVPPRQGPRPPSGGPKLSPRNAEIIEAAADGISDPGLSHALRRLARRAKTPPR